MVLTSNVQEIIDDQLEMSVFQNVLLNFVHITLFQGRKNTDELQNHTQEEIQIKLSFQVSVCASEFLVK